MHLNSMRIIDTNPVQFYLYTRANPTSPTEITETAESINCSYFDANKPIYFIIHGWTQDAGAWTSQVIKDAALNSSDCNVFLVNWDRAKSLDYFTSVYAVRGVGAKVAEFIDSLDICFDNLTVVGHSLGAHVAGFAGKGVKNGQINVIVGLDAALPLFSYDRPEERLSENDAAYVASIQTNGGNLGFLKPIGKGSFYPNGGEHQPRCSGSLEVACSHMASVIYYAESFSNRFGCYECSKYTEAVNKDCGSTFSNVIMGAHEPSSRVAGVFLVPVTNEPPYGIDPR
ncbi:lipase member H-A-like [Haematobia irritans]|uniref:lipase member H-A-like n=1 Tax=Haematobia irritans TaxID=7368 RepID=UPI003F4FE086